ncbi:unnamed protein product, partial [Darwinula stevensoni]
MELLDHTRTSAELETMLNHDPTLLPDLDPEDTGQRMKLERLKLAIDYRQKKFVAHANVQQLLASVWYDGMPGFRRNNFPSQCLELAKIGSCFPIVSVAYILRPHGTLGTMARKPFIKFIVHSASYMFFLCE